MPDHVDSHHRPYGLTRKCLTFLWRQLRGFIVRNLTVLIERPDRNSLLRFAAGRENCSTRMACTDPIDIISSDSEDEPVLVTRKELSLPMTSAASAPPRKLPSWASTSSTKPNGYSGPFQHQKLPARASSSTRSLTNHEHPSEVDFHKYRSSMDAAPNGNQDLSTFNQEVDQPVNGLPGDHSQSITSRYTDMHTDDYGNVLSQQSLRRSLPSSFQPSTSTAKAFIENGGDSKISDTRSSDYQSLGRNDTDHRMYGTDNLDGKNNNEIIMYEPSRSRTLPPSFQPSASTAKGKASMENGGNTKISGTHIKPYQSLGPDTVDHKIHRAYDLGGKSKTEAIMHGNNGSRLLPASLKHANLLPNLQSAGPSDPPHRSGVEEGPTENDERLIYQAALQNLSQPKTEATLPEGLMSVPLLRHQKIALAWMLAKEKTGVPCSGGILADDQGLGKTISMIALILLQRPLQSKPTANDLDTVKTEALNLDDDDEGTSEMGGIKQSEVSGEIKTPSKVKSVEPTFYKGRPAAGTLVVCPASVLRQWASELDDKITSGARLSVLIYHGGTRTKNPDELAKYDVVLTTYAIVANEVPKQPLAGDDDEDKKDGEKYGLSSEFSNNKKRKKVSNVNKKGKKGRKGLDSSFDCGSGALAKVGWFRVILDEAQTIKNHRTQVARACCGLRAKRRWCLSGTPIQNAIDDLFSYFRFLKYDPYAAYKCFCSAIKYPISKNAVLGYGKLQAVLKTIMLRRTKGALLHGEPIISLPPKSICLVKVDFSVEERKFYTKLEADSRSQFKAYAAAGTVNQNYASILLMLLRLRQACDHPLLVKGRDSDFVGKASVEMARRLPREMLMNLLNLLEDPICSLCSDPPEQAVVTMCGHVFCYQCVSEYLTGDDNLCPAHECKEQVGTDVVFAKATLRNCISNDISDNTLSLLEGVDKSLALQNMYTSSKIRAALEILEKQANSILEGRPFKAIVFSQWTGMLDLVESALNLACIQYRRFDGTMSLSSRDKAVKDFNNDPEVTVMLMSLKAGNLGLNLVAACHVILLDLWWNPTTEDQAIDRAHRIGQTRPVTVSRLTITETVEDRILSLQEDKRKMVASAFGEDHKGGSATRLTVEDLRYLFKV